MELKFGQELKVEGEPYQVESCFQKTPYALLHWGSHPPSGSSVVIRVLNTGRIAGPNLRAIWEANERRRDCGSALDRGAASIYGMDASAQVLVMEKVPHRFSLRRQPAVPIDLLELRDQLRETLVAVQEWHNLGFLHGDLHPGNFMQRLAGTVAIDFDSMRPRTSHELLWIRNKDYSSQEVWDRVPDPTADVFSIAAMAAQGMGSEFVSATGIWETHTSYPRKDRRPEDLTDPLRRIVDRRWAGSPEALQAAHQIVQVVNVGTHPIQAKRPDNPAALLEILGLPGSDC